MGHRRKQWKSENRGKFNETFKTCRLLKQHLKENLQPKLLKLEKEGRLALFSYVCNITSKKKNNSKWRREIKISAIIKDTERGWRQKSIPWKDTID